MICIQTHNNQNIFYFRNHHILVQGTKSYVNLTMGLEGSSLPVKNRNTNIWACAAIGIPLLVKGYTTPLESCFFGIHGSVFGQQASLSPQSLLEAPEA